MTDGESFLERMARTCIDQGSDSGTEPVTLRYSLLSTSTPMETPEMTMAAGLALKAFLKMATNDCRNTSAR